MTSPPAPSCWIFVAMALGGYVRQKRWSWGRCPPARAAICSARDRYLPPHGDAVQA
ncbi:MAG: hypothetical protein ACLUHE_04875 [Christensenellales bacterium]